jgi:negative regulator of flagellin synthesis FlgM
MKVSGSKVGGAGTMESADKSSATKKTDNANGAKTSQLAQSNKGSSLSTEKVNLSPRVQEMQKIKDIAMKGKDDIDEAKVARLQAMIDAGEYKVDANAIAEKLLDEHLNMPS